MLKRYLWVNLFLFQPSKIIVMSTEATKANFGEATELNAY